MFFVYVLKSKKDGKLYVGSTNNLRKRLEEHNKKKNHSTKNRIPLELVYYEAYKAEKDARKREKSLKLRGQARYHLKQRLASSLRAK